MPIRVPQTFAISIFQTQTRLWAKMWLCTNFWVHLSLFSHIARDPKTAKGGHLGGKERFLLWIWKLNTQKLWCALMQIAQDWYRWQKYFTDSKCRPDFLLGTTEGVFVQNQDMIVFCRNLFYQPPFNHRFGHIRWFGQTELTAQYSASLEWSPVLRWT